MLSGKELARQYIQQGKVARDARIAIKGDPVDSLFNLLSDVPPEVIQSLVWYDDNGVAYSKFSQKYAGE